MAGIKQRDLVNLAGSGLELFLGPLEASVMRAIWDNKTTTRKIWQYVRDNYRSPNTDESAYTSVTSTVSRLYDRGYLTRTGDRNAGFSYTPVHATEDEFVNDRLSRAINTLLDNYPREAGRIFVNYVRSAQNAK